MSRTSVRPASAMPLGIRAIACVLATTGITTTTTAQVRRV